MTKCTFIEKNNFYLVIWEFLEETHIRNSGGSFLYYSISKIGSRCQEKSGNQNADQIVGRFGLKKTQSKCQCLYDNAKRSSCYCSLENIGIISLMLLSMMSTFFN